MEVFGGSMVVKNDETDEVICESYSEVCYWPLSDEKSTVYSKTGTPVTAFCVRVETLENVDGEILEVIRVTGSGFECDVTNDDLLNAFVLAVTRPHRQMKLSQCWKVTAATRKVHQWR